MEVTMSRNRMHLKNTVHFITNRTEHELFLLLPTADITEIIQGWFARAHTMFGEGLEIFAFIFLSDHFHILCNDTKGTLAAFMWYFQSNVAKAVNQAHNRRGRFWSRKYDDVIVEGDDALLNRYAYTVCNAVKAGLVDKSDEWIGWSSLEGALSDGSYAFDMLNKTKLHNATRRGQKVDVSKFVETWRFELTVPNKLAQKSDAEKQQFIRELTATAEAEYRSLRGDKPPLGVTNILAQQPFDRPLNPSFRTSIQILCTDKTQKEEWKEAYRTFVGGYRTVYEGYKNASLNRRKKASVEWPEGSYAPSCFYPIGVQAAI
jgi:REP element-mobilizing transposase RayT